MEVEATYLNNGKFCVARHRAREVVRRVAEHAVPDLVDFPRAHKRDVARDRRLEHELAPVELARLLLVPRDSDARLHAALLQANRDRALLDGGVGTRGGVERGEAGGLRVQTADERALWDELHGDLAVQVEGLEVLVPGCEINMGISHSFVNVLPSDI